MHQGMSNKGLNNAHHASVFPAHRVLLANAATRLLSAPLIGQMEEQLLHHVGVPVTHRHMERTLPCLHTHTHTVNDKASSSSFLCAVLFPPPPSSVRLLPLTSRWGLPPPQAGLSASSHLHVELPHAPLSLRPGEGGHASGIHIL